MYNIIVGPRLGQSASMGGGSTPDGWNTVGGRPNLRGERQTIDPARLKLFRVRVIDIGQKNDC